VEVPEQPSVEVPAAAAAESLPIPEAAGTAAEGLSALAAAAEPPSFADAFVAPGDAVTSESSLLASRGSVTVGAIDADEEAAAAAAAAAQGHHGESVLYRHAGGVVAAVLIAAAALAWLATAACAARLRGKAPSRLLAADAKATHAVHSPYGSCEGDALLWGEEHGAQA